MNNICPACGYPDLDEPAYRPTPRGGLGSLEICPSCGFQFGYDDDAEHITHEQWRERWMAKGMPWSSAGISAPLNWNPRDQLQNVGVKA